MKQPHKHAELIKAWADGAEIEIKYLPNGDWHMPDVISWLDGAEYRIKPEPPKSYVTQLSFSDAVPNVDYSKLKSVSIGGIDFVPAAMLEKVAKAVRDACLAPANTSTFVEYSSQGNSHMMRTIDINAIIKRVREAK